MTQTNVQFIDRHPAQATVAEEVLRGLRARHKRVSPKYFYDHAGSRLFAEICRQPEYYPTRVERRLLQENAGGMARCIGASALIYEPGSGSSAKIRILLDAMRPKEYVACDISKNYLLTAAGALAGEYPWLTVTALCADFTQVVKLPSGGAAAKKVAFFPGSSIGNFEPMQAQQFLRNVRLSLGDSGGLLIGFDRKKDVGMLEAAYNDARGVTARFNLNVLTHLNRELYADFDTANFSHRAFYNERLGRIEMHLVSKREHSVSVAGETICFTRGETLHTENSYKFHDGEFENIATSAGYRHVRSWSDARQFFSVHYYEF